MYCTMNAWNLALNNIKRTSLPPAPSIKVWHKAHRDGLHIRCTRCKDWKHEDEFRKVSGKEWRRSQCRACEVELNRLSRQRSRRSGASQTHEGFEFDDGGKDRNTGAAPHA